MKIRLLILCLAFISLVSCSKKFSIRESAVGKTLEMKDLDFVSMKAKGSLNYRDDSITLKAIANVRIQKDSAIWLSFSRIGIEGVRAIITQDSLVVLDRFKKLYYVMDFETLSRQFNFEINYDMVQSMILGEPPFEFSEESDVTQEGNYFHVQQEENEIRINNYINAANMKVERIELEEIPTKNTLKLNYGNYVRVNEQPFPFLGILFLNYSDGNQRYSTKISFDYSKVEFSDRKIKLPFNIPQKYVKN